MLGSIIDFKCPYCSHEYQKYIWSGVSHIYNGELYDEAVCHNCNETFLFKTRSDGTKCVKTPDGFNKDKFYSFWVS